MLQYLTTWQKCSIKGSCGIALYVCMHACMRACVHAWVCACMHVCVCVCVCVHSCTQTCALHKTSVLFFIASCKTQHIYMYYIKGTTPLSKGISGFSNALHAKNNWDRIHWHTLIQIWSDSILALLILERLIFKDFTLWSDWILQMDMVDKSYMWHKHFVHQCRSGHT